jgi:transposase
VIQTSQRQGGLDGKAGLLAKRRGMASDRAFAAAWSALAHRVDDRRVISGIVQMLRCGARWRDCPEVYGPYTTIYNRFNRWSRQGIWTDIFYALT